MDDQPDENTKEFSMEELNVWNVEKLRKYFKYCGIAIANDTRISRIARLVIESLPCFSATFATV